MKKILIITDAWEPQVNGVVTTMTTVVQKLREKNFVIPQCPTDQSTTETASSGTRAILPGSLREMWYSFLG